jgi:hypothetical protein
LSIFVIIEGSHVLLWVLVAVCLAYLNYCVPLRSKSSVICMSILSISSIQR